jgi:outer membrane protein TolC
VKNWFWYNTNQVGLSVNIPIFDGTIKKHRISQAQFNQQKVANTLDQVKKGIDLELTASRNSLHTAIQTLDVQEDNMELAEKVFNTVKKKYEQGLGSSFEVLQSDNEMQQAQSNYFRALYEAIVAKVNYLKAVGKL